MMRAAQPTPAVHERHERRLVLVACCLAGCAVWVEPPASIFRPPAALAFGSGWVAYDLLIAMINLAVIACYVGGGTLGDLLGRRKVLLAGLAGLIVGNLLLLLSPSVPWFVATRLATSLAGALTVPLTLSLIYLAFAGDDEGRHRAITLYVVVITLAKVAAAILGGLLHSLPDWRLAFLPPVLLGAAGLIMLLRYAQESAAKPGERYVALGTTASTWTLLALAFGLHVVWVAGPYAPHVLAASLCSAVLGAALLIWSDRRAHGRQLLRGLGRRRTLIILTVFGVAMQIGTAGYLAQTRGAFEVVYGFGGGLALLALTPLVAGTLLVSLPRLQEWAARLSRRAAMSGGLLTVGLSCLGIWLLFGQGSYITIAALMVAFGVGSTVANSAWTSTYLQSTSGELIGARTGMTSAISRTGDMVGAALTSALLASAGSSDYVRRLLGEGLREEQVRSAREALDMLLSPSTVGTAALDPAITRLLLSDYRSSYAAAFEQVMLALGMVCLLASVLAWIGLRPQTARIAIAMTGPHQEG
jgi:MFS family permease